MTSASFPMKLSFVIGRIFPKRIWQQIFVILFLLVVFPLVFLGALLLQTSQKAIKTTVLRDHQQIAIQASGKIKEHIDGSREALFVTASILGTLHADAWRQETAIVELSLRNSAFQRISSLNERGQEIATSELGTELRHRVGETAFQEAFIGHSYISEVKIADNYIPFITVAEPIKQLGKIQGVLVADLNLRSIWNVIDGIRIGQLGKAYLIDKRGRIIAHPDKKLVLQNAVFTHPKVIQNIFAGLTGSIEEVDPKGSAWLTSYAPVEKLKWGLIITQPQSEVLIFSRQMNAHSIFLIALSILAAFLISLIMTRYMSFPIREMVEGTKRMARGDYSHSLQIRGRGEIDKLLFSFNQMSKKLKKAKETEKLSVIGLAATAIAHDMKNSLQLVDTFVKLLPDRHQDKQFIKEFSETIPKELDSWNVSLRNMMTYAGNTPFLMSTLNVNDLIKEIIFLIQHKARQVNISVETDLNEHLPAIMGNEEKLRQVLLNILTNALEATPGHGHIVVATRTPAMDEGRSCVEIEITNTGDGIKKEDKDKIFEPFYSTKCSGLGLGLSISKEIIGHHNGRIHVVSDENAVTSFIIQLPSVKVSMV